jgi:hypothetical protein
MWRSSPGSSLGLAAVDAETESRNSRRTHCCTSVRDVFGLHAPTTTTTAITLSLLHRYYVIYTNQPDQARRRARHNTRRYEHAAIRPPTRGYVVFRRPANPSSCSSAVRDDGVTNKSAVGSRTKRSPCPFPHACPILSVLVDVSNLQRPAEAQIPHRKPRSNPTPSPLTSNPVPKTQKDEAEPGTVSLRVPNRRAGIKLKVPLEIPPGRTFSPLSLLKNRSRLEHASCPTSTQSCPCFVGSPVHGFETRGGSSEETGALQSRPRSRIPRAQQAKTKVIWLNEREKDNSTHNTRVRIVLGPVQSVVAAEGRDQNKSLVPQPSLESTKRSDDKPKKRKIYPINSAIVTAAPPNAPTMLC